MVENSRQALSTQRLTYTVISREGGGGSSSNRCEYVD